jgi:hypothetical protein
LLVEKEDVEGGEVGEDLKEDENSDAMLGN